MTVVRHPYNLTEDTAPNNNRFAVIEFSGRQYKIAEVSEVQ